MKTKSIYKIIIAIFLLIFLLYWLDLNDFYQSNYNNLTKKEEKIFEWKSDYDSYMDHRKVYGKYFNNKRFCFPRQDVYKIKILKKDKWLKLFWISKTIKPYQNNEIISFFNNPHNFDWGETTVEESDKKYILKFYDYNDRVVGKLSIFDCRYVKSVPFSPNMKY